MTTENNFHAVIRKVHSLVGSSSLKSRCEFNFLLHQRLSLWSLLLSPFKIGIVAILYSQRSNNGNLLRLECSVTIIKTCSCVQSNNTRNSTTGVFSLKNIKIKYMFCRIWICHSKHRYPSGWVAGLFTSPRSANKLKGPHSVNVITKCLVLKFLLWGMLCCHTVIVKTRDISPIISSAMNFLSDPGNVIC